MVVDTGTERTENHRLNIRCLPHPPIRRLKSKAAADDAARIADCLTATRYVDQGLDETALFTALHTCAYQATHAAPQAGDSAEAQDEWSRRWSAMRDYLVERNLGLAYAMAGRFRSTGVERDDLCGEALFGLVRATERFNPWCGFRFSTYACNVIIRALIRLVTKVSQYRIRFPGHYDAALERPSRADAWSELFVDRLSQALEENAAELTEREVTVLGWRFPKDGGAELTLAQVGDILGLSKERVRQIQDRALAKLRNVLETDPILQ